MTQEQIILAEAEKLFLTKGFNGTSTTEIAKNANCNQALVHYYFRTKELLFQRIFSDKVQSIMSRLLSYVHTDRDFLENMCCIIDGYFDFLNSNRQLPFMIINELVLNPYRCEMVRNIFIQNSTRMKLFDYLSETLEREIAEGRIRRVDPFDVILHILSLTVTTFISLPIYSSVFDKDDQQTDAYILHRREEVKESLMRYLKA